MRVRFGRTASLRVNRFLDQAVPPALRDTRLFAAVARAGARELPVDIATFKDQAFAGDASGLTAFYRAFRSRLDQGETDLTPASAEAVLAAVVGARVLDVACGQGWLARQLAARGHTVVGCDVVLSGRECAGGVRLAVADVGRLPFRDGAFDTVVSTHTLEHVVDLAGALAELRRVASRRLIVVVPRQRPYQVTFNPHLHFFPYAWSLRAWTGTRPGDRLELVGGDWLYVEERDGA